VRRCTIATHIRLEPKLIAKMIVTAVMPSPIVAVCFASHLAHVIPPHSVVREA